MEQRKKANHWNAATNNTRMQANKKKERKKLRKEKAS